MASFFVFLLLSIFLFLLGGGGGMCAALDSLTQSSSHLDLIELGATAKQFDRQAKHRITWAQKVYFVAFDGEYKKLVFWKC